MIVVLISAALTVVATLVPYFLWSRRSPRRLMATTDQRLPESEAYCPKTYAEAIELEMRRRAAGHEDPTAPVRRYVAAEARRAGLLNDGLAVGGTTLYECNGCETMHPLPINDHCGLMKAQQPVKVHYLSTDRRTA